MVKSFHSILFVKSQLRRTENEMEECSCGCYGLRALVVRGYHACKDEERAAGAPCRWWSDRIDRRRPQHNHISSSIGLELHGYPDELSGSGKLPDVHRLPYTRSLPQTDEAQGSLMTVTCVTRVGAGRPTAWSMSANLLVLIFCWRSHPIIFIESPLSGGQESPEIE